MLRQFFLHFRIFQVFFIDFLKIVIVWLIIVNDPDSLFGQGAVDILNLVFIQFHISEKFCNIIKSKCFAAVLNSCRQLVDYFFDFLIGCSKAAVILP